MDVSWYLLVRAIHLISASIWFGSIVFSTLVLVPTVRSAGEPGRGFMGALQARGGIARFIGPVAGITLLSGAVVYWRAGYLQAPFETTSSTLLTLGALLATVAWFYGMVANVALQRKTRFASPEEARALQASHVRRGRIGSSVIIAAFLMMVGRGIVN
jgi:hypothetical protein